MRLKQSKGVQDFNRALAINPTLFQVRMCGLIIKIDVVNVVHMLARDVFDVAKRRC